MASRRSWSKSRVILTAVVMTTMLSPAVSAAGDEVFPKCVKQLSPCSCQTDNGVVDLSPLDSKNPAKSAFDNVPADGGGTSDTASYNPCTAFSQTTCTDAAICVKPQWGSTFSAGSQDSAKFTNTGINGKLAIQYSTTTGYTCIVTLECDRKADTKFSAQKIPISWNPTVTGQFTLTSRYACPGSGGSGMSVGTILCIVLICIVVVYLIGGVIVMRCIRHATGVEMIPNVTFWRELPGLVKDGAAFVVSPMMRKSGYDVKI